MSDARVQVFASYARPDKKYLGRFRDHTASLREDGIVIFADTDIPPGEHWRERLFAQLDDADIFVALLTAKYAISAFCQEELRRALHRHSAGDCIVLPVNVGPVDLGENHPLRLIQHVPDGQAISRRGAGQDAAWTEVARALRDAADRFRAKRQRRLPNAWEYEAEDNRLSSEASDNENPGNVTSLDQYRRHRDAGIWPEHHRRVPEPEASGIAKRRISPDLDAFINALRSAHFDSSDWRTMSSGTSRLRKELARLRALRPALTERVDALVAELDRTLAAASGASADTRTVRSAAARCDQIRDWLLQLVADP